MSREANVRMPLESAMFIRTGQAYQAMKHRFGERRIKTGRLKERITQYARPIPFTLDQFREWLLKQLGGNPNGTTRCVHCGMVLDAINVSFDHLAPVSQGGSLGLENLGTSCDECNRMKGKLTAPTFHKLMEWLNRAGRGEGEMTVMDRTDIIKRLKGGGIFYKEKKKSDPKPAPVQEEVF